MIQVRFECNQEEAGLNAGNDFSVLCSNRVKLGYQYSWTTLFRGPEILLWVCYLIGLI